MEVEETIRIFVKIKGNRKALRQLKEKLIELIEEEGVDVVGWLTIDKEVIKE